MQHTDERSACSACWGGGGAPAAAVTRKSAAAEPTTASGLEGSCTHAAALPALLLPLQAPWRGAAATTATAASSARHVTLTLSPVEGGRGSTTLSVALMAGKEVSSVVAAAEAKRGEATCSAPPGPLGGPREVKGVAQRPGTVRQERGGGVVVVVRVAVGVTVPVREGVGVAVKVEDVVLVSEGVGERDGVGEGEGVAVPQPAALPTPSAKPVLGGQGSGSVLPAGQ